MSSRKTWPWRWIATGLAVLVAIVAVKFLPVTEWLKGFNEWIKSLGPWGMLLYIGVYATATVLFVPGWILTVGAGLAFGLFWGTFTALIGATIGATFAFLIARYVARDAVSKRFGKSAKFQAIDEAIGQQGWKMVGLLRLSPLIPFNLSNYLYGLTAIAFVPYFLATLVGMLPGALLYVYLGTIGKIGLEASKGTADKSTLEYAFLGIGLVATIIVTILVTRAARHALKQKT